MLHIDIVFVKTASVYIIQRTHSDYEIQSDRTQTVNITVLHTECRLINLNKVHYIEHF